MGEGGDQRLGQIILSLAAAAAKPRRSFYRSLCTGLERDGVVALDLREGERVVMAGEWEEGVAGKSSGGGMGQRRGS